MHSPTSRHRHPSPGPSCWARPRSRARRNPRRRDPTDKSPRPAFRTNGAVSAPRATDRVVDRSQKRDWGTTTRALPRPNFRSGGASDSKGDTRRCAALDSGQLGTVADNCVPGMRAFGDHEMKLLKLVGAALLIGCLVAAPSVRAQDKPGEKQPAADKPATDKAAQPTPKAEVPMVYVL